MIMMIYMKHKNEMKFTSIKIEIMHVCMERWMDAYIYVKMKIEN